MAASKSAGVYCSSNCLLFVMGCVLLLSIKYGLETIAGCMGSKTNDGKYAGLQEDGGSVAVTEEGLFILRQRARRFWNQTCNDNEQHEYHKQTQ